MPPPPWLLYCSNNVLQQRLDFDSSNGRLSPGFNCTIHTYIQTVFPFRHKHTRTHTLATTNHQTFFYFHRHVFLPSTLAQRSSQLSTSQPPDGTLVSPRHIISSVSVANIIAILEHIGEANTKERRYLRRRHDSSKSNLNHQLDEQGEPLRGPRAAKAQRSRATFLLPWP